MKLFSEMAIFEAYDHVAAGGQALHVFMAAKYFNVPTCFKRDRQWGHLLDNDAGRLKATAKRLGVRVIKVGRPGVKGQHVDLCGRPLALAIEECRQESMFREAK